MSRRIVLASAMAGAIVCALASAADAHVSIDPPSAPQGGTVKLSFLVPNEEARATVTKVQIAFPTPPDAPIPGVSVGQKPGWKSTVTTKRLAKAITTDDGTITDVVSEIDWVALTPAAAVKPGEFGEFTIDADGLPDDEDQVVFKAVQTYSNGKVVRWIDPVTPGESPAGPSTRRRSSSSPPRAAAPRRRPRARCRRAAPARSSRRPPRTTAHARSGSSGSRSAPLRSSARRARW